MGQVDSLGGEYVQRFFQRAGFVDQLDQQRQTIVGSFPHPWLTDLQRRKIPAPPLSEPVSGDGRKAGPPQEPPLDGGRSRL